MSAPTLTFTPPMFHASKSGFKDTTRRLLNLTHMDEELMSRARILGRIKSTALAATFTDRQGFCKKMPYPHLPGQIKPMVTTWAVNESLDHLKPSELNGHGFEIWFNDGSAKPSWCGKSRPGRFLPKTLYALAPQVEILTVHPEFLLDITEASARREGIAQITKYALVRGDETVWIYGLADRDGLPGTDNFGWPWNQWCRSAREAYFQLWDSINADRDEGQYAAAKNPAVWVITYRLI